jgi:hypothetical protein
MVRAQLYLPETLYKTLKEKAKSKNMTFASYVRIYLERENVPEVKTKDLHKAFPFIKVAGGMLSGKLSGKYLTNEDIDKAIYDL